MSQPIEYITTITRDCTSTKVGGRLHSINDQPAEIWADGGQFWYHDGKRHRDNDQPAVIWANGTQFWYINDKRHRDNDQPAEIWPNGRQCWYRNGEKHRDNDEPAEIRVDGTQFWYVNGKPHRGNNQPAAIYAEGGIYWFVDGKLHRDNGPAKITEQGYEYWYINGVKQRKPTAVDNVSTPTIISMPKSNNMVKFIANVHIVDYGGTIKQIVNIDNTGMSSVIYELTFRGEIDQRTYYTIDIKPLELNSISWMRVLKGDGWVIAAMVNNNWITGVKL